MKESKNMSMAAKKVLRSSFSNGARLTHGALAEMGLAVGYVRGLPLENIQTLIIALRTHLSVSTDAERLSILALITEGYCIYCGSKQGPCFCMKDE